MSAYMKPISTLMKPLRSVDLTTLEEAPAAIERSDVCAVPAAAVVGEAVVCLVLADAVLERFGGDSMRQLQAHVRRRQCRICGNASAAGRSAPRRNDPSDRQVRREPSCTSRHAPSRPITPEIVTLVDDMMETMYAAPGHRAGGAADRRAAAHLRHRSVGRTRPGGAHHDDQSRVRRAGRHAARGRRLPEPPRLQRHGARGRSASSCAASTATAASDTVEGTGLLARAFQHEMDHLDGRLFVDRLRGIKRDLIVRKIRKLARQREVVMRIVFFGTPAFAVPTLAALLDSRHQVVGVVTQPDRPRGRGQKVSPTRRSRRSRSPAGCRCCSRTRLARDVVRSEFSALRPDLGVVAAYGKILPEWLLAMPPHGMINVHASLLPKYRGAAPVHRAVIDGEPQTGVTIMRVVKALDAGPMLATVTRAIGPDETSDAVERDLATLGAELLVQVVDDLAAGPAREVPQNDADATYAPRLTKEEGLLDFTLPAHGRPQPRARPAPLADGLHVSERPPARRPPARFDSADGPTAVAWAPAWRADAARDRDRLRRRPRLSSSCNVQPEGRRVMSARDYLAGHGRWLDRASTLRVGACHGGSRAAGGVSGAAGDCRRAAPTSATR